MLQMLWPYKETYRIQRPVIQILVRFGSYDCVIPEMLPNLDRENHYLITFKANRKFNR